ncbi:Glycosyltransferase involved in cell wall bisynthesis [Salegentibacter echinorum]|uniref:Glycosyltransferase involved in cell wall bisynthesis n=1 Tax=Salegentibacter echinorum TaxID=1073325 RepID=A0A1M5FI15_SALEC|nr:glycosyltransferase family A protein [Salegentibacter echinorum]SHF91217.1 Glycosyltransferase involved in cell wall bisynthesis [Salegentibacter echinorum]
MAFFSIITPVYNNSKSIGNTISSILAQNFEDWELILVDDGSKDNLLAALEPFLGDVRIKLLEQENKGVARARNNGVAKATGNFITFLDSDDEVETNWLKDFKELIEQAANIGYVSCGFFRNGKKTLPKLNKAISPAKYASLAGTFALRKDIFLEIGGYDDVLKQSENWEMTARALEYCKNNNLAIAHTDNLNFNYENYPTAAQTRLRDEYRGDATYHLYKKYLNGGVLHFRKDDLLLSSAVNYTRAGKFKKSRKVFYENFKKNPSPGSFLKLILFKIPFLRRKKWMR